MKQITKRGFQLIVLGASWTAIILLGTMHGMGNTDFFIMTGVLAVVAIAYGAFLLLWSGLVWLLAFETIRRIAEVLARVLLSIVLLTLAAVGLYLGYLFVSWAGFIGTILAAIAGLLLVIVALLSSH